MSNFEKKQYLSYTIKNFDLYFGVLTILYVIAINLMSRAKVAFSMPTIIVGICFIIYHFTKNTLKKLFDENRNFRISVKIIKMITAIGILFLMCLEGIIVLYPKYDTSDADYILVLGAGLIDGTHPNQILQLRLNAAADCVDKYGNTGKIIVSGGKGSDEKISEAQAMKSYLVSKGIDEDNILIENQSTNTNENFKFSKEKIEQDSDQSINDLSVKIITTDFHAFRSEFLAKRNGYNNIQNYSSKTVWYMAPVMYVREAFAIVKSVFFDK